MRFRSRPLVVRGLDAELYLERPRVERALLNAIDAGRNVLLLGKSGAGKTTSLRRLDGELADRGRSVAWVNPSLASTAEELLQLVAAAVAQAHERAGHRTPPPEDETAVREPTGAIRLLQALRQIPPTPPVVILVDGLLDPDVGYDVFGRLRDQLWMLEHQWILASTLERASAVRTPPADAFWSATVEMPDLDVEEVRRLLARGLEHDELKRVLRNGAPPPGTPRQVIRAAEEVLTRQDPSPAPSGLRRTFAVGAREFAASRLSRPASMALAELEALGRPASAADAELLARTGWTRAYLGRTLGALEAEGIVRSFNAPATGRGRPAKLYEPNPDFGQPQE